jgi:chemotaxis protein methyltransferase CheR
VSSRSSSAEFEFSDAEFERLRHFVRRHTGIHLTHAKRELLYGRVARRLRKLQLSSFSDYCSLVESADSTELQELTNAVTTNLTSFFRESHHFETLAGEAFEQLSRSPTRRLRFWSAGCSTGEEPYSIAMTLRESYARLAGWDIKLLATDIDSKVLGSAAQGRYELTHCEGLSAERRVRWFDQVGNAILAKPELKSLITFKQLNLFDEWPMRGPFDMIFCRNVIIYFDKERQRELFSRMAQLQPPGGWLFIGHSENLFNVTDRYKAVGRTTYRREA